MDVLIHCRYFEWVALSCMYYHRHRFLFKGGSLHALIKRARQYDDVINETELTEWLIQIALALQHLHTRWDKHILHSFWIFLKHLFKSTTTQRCSRLQHWYCVRVNMPKHYRQLRVKDLPKVPMWWLEWDLDLQDAMHQTYHYATTPQLMLIIINVNNINGWNQALGSLNSHEGIF